VALVLIASVCLADPAASATTRPAVSNATPGTSWTQQAELEASPFFGPADSFGASVDISGTTAIVGAKESAGAYIFTNTAGSWKQVATLRPNDGSGAVAISGSTAVLGTTVIGSGPDAYVFSDEGGSWVQEAVLTTGAGVSEAVTVAASRSTVAVGTFGAHGDPGAVYVFGNAGGSWVQQAKLTAPAGAEQYTFGSSVALTGSTMVVGEVGAASVFTRQESHWTRQARLTAPDSSGAVAVSGSTVIAGGDPDTYVFTDSGGTWSQQGELVNPPKAVNDLFGDSVAVSGSTVVVGAEFNDHYRGSAYVFKHAKGSWIHAGKLVASDRRACFSTDEGRFCDDFGNSVAMSGTSIIVGSEGWGGQTGSAYVFVPAAPAGDPSA
jgi:hypothetical protein